MRRRLAFLAPWLVLLTLAGGALAAAPQGGGHADAATHGEAAHDEVAIAPEGLDVGAGHRVAHRPSTRLQPWPNSRTSTKCADSGFKIGFGSNRFRTNTGDAFVWGFVITGPSTMPGWSATKFMFLQ